MMDQAGGIDRGASSLRIPDLRSAWLLWLGWAALAIPTIMGLADAVWSTEQGAHGPIVLATGIWLLVRARADILRVAQPGAPVLAALGLIIGLPAYLFFHITSMLFFEGLALFLIGLSIFYYHFGARALAMLWFPVLYLLFILPVPYFIVSAVTRVLKLELASASAAFLATLGYNVASSGVTLYIDQYQMLVATACSGLNSLIGLSAIGLFYIYLRYSNSWQRALLLLPFVPLFAIAANYFRVVLLMLSVHYFGIVFSELVVHNIASAFMFTISVSLLIVADGIMNGIGRLVGIGGQA